MQNPGTYQIAKKKKIICSQIPEPTKALPLDHPGVCLPVWTGLGPSSSNGSQFMRLKPAESFLATQWELRQVSLISSWVRRRKDRYKRSEREGQAQEETKIVDAPDHEMHSVKVTGLRAYSGYRVFVSAYTIVGNGPENTVATLVDTGEDRELFLWDFRFQDYLYLSTIEIWLWTFIIFPET